MKLKSELPSRETVEKRLDVLWSKKVKEKDKNICLVCGKVDKLHSHHILSRKNKGTRWELKNGICLCAWHHRYLAHGDPEKFRDFIVNKISEREYTLLKMKAYAPSRWSLSDLILLERELNEVKV